MTELLRRLKINVVVRRYEAILIGSVMLLSGAVMPSSWEPPLRYLPPPKVNLPPTHPWIALTFDDGPHPARTEELLAVLRQAHVPATFFVVGKMADRYPQLVRMIAREGHELANHTYDHLDMARLSNDQVLYELNATRDTVQRLTGQDAYLFRPPGGDFSRRMVKLTAKAGYHMILWSVQTNDVEHASQLKIEHKILLGAQDGAVVLMHSGIENTIKALPDVIAKLRERGFHFVTVSTLMGLPRTMHVPAAESAPIQTASTKKY